MVSTVHRIVPAKLLIHSHVIMSMVPVPVRMDGQELLVQMTSMNVLTFQTSVITLSKNAVILMDHTTAVVYQDTVLMLICNV